MAKLAKYPLRGMMLHNIGAHQQDERAPNKSADQAIIGQGTYRVVVVWRPDELSNKNIEREYVQH